MKKDNDFSCLFGHNIISSGLTWPLEIIWIKKTTKLVLLFPKKHNYASFPLVQHGSKKHESVKFNKPVLIVYINIACYLMIKATTEASSLLYIHHHLQTLHLPK